MLGPDEPRYAAVGEAMAHSGDLITPRLWGSPWFEKPPLLYWMTAAGTRARLKPEVAARLPVALLSLGFLAASFLLLRREFCFLAAAVSTALLATSAGWIVYSSLCLTDLPLAVSFSLAVYLALPLLRASPHTAYLRWRLFGVGVALGLAMLAKGLVPIALALPFCWFLWTFRRSWWAAIAGCTAIAGPWYIAVYVRNGYPFLQEFFLKHHFERLYSASLQHVQPWYFYFPVMLGGLFPWTPLFALLGLRGPAWDKRRRFLLTIAIFGLLFFSISRNKLPGYLLPLLPPGFALLGAHFETRRIVELSRAWLVPCALLIALIPLLAPALPPSLSLGRVSLAGIKDISRTEWFYVALPLAVVVFARRSWAGVLLALCVISGGIYLKEVDYPVLDKNVSARGLWSELKPLPESVCDNWAGRDWIYGLSFYRGALIPPCGDGKFDYALQSQGHAPPHLQRLN